MPHAPVLRWSDLAARWARHPRGHGLGHAAWLLAAGLLGGFAPLAAVLAASTLLLLGWLWRAPWLAPLLCIACMGNTKFNLFLGFFTLFPEYLAIGGAVVVAALDWAERPRAPREPGFVLLFAALTAAGLLSSVFAIEVAPVVARALLIPVAGAVFWLTATRLRDPEALDRGLRWYVGTTLVVSMFGVVQMVGIYLFKRNLDLSFLRRFGNPDFEYSVGAPVLHQLTSTFRANGLFNDPNIFAGLLAAAIPVLAALALGPWSRVSRARGLAVWCGLALALLSLVLTLSRSGTLGAVVGLAVMLAASPRWLRDGRLWAGVGVLASAAIAVSTAIGVNAFLIVIRLATSFESHDVSARTHENAFWYAIDLFLRYPLTGVGLRNYGPHYIREIEPAASTMMAHNAFLSWFAETGVVGGGIFLLLCAAVVRRVWAARRDPAAAARDPVVHAMLPGFLGAFAALAVTNVFYDFSLRTFVWVTAGLGVAAASRVAAGHGERP